jgi:hypothetical protein
VASFVHGAGGVFIRRLPLLVLWTLLSALPARAAPDETEAGAEGELDLQVLEEDGLLSDEALAALLDLREARVDLERASRAELYGLPGLTYARVDALLTERESGGSPEAVLTPEELRRLEPFLSRHGREGLSGGLRGVTAYAPSDVLGPPVALQARVEGLAGLRAGVLASLTRRRLGAVWLDARRGALLAEAPAAALSLPKLYVQWTGERASVLVGTYRLGFGQRLTLDTTSRPTPDGFSPDDAFLVKGGGERLCQLAGGCAREGDITPDFRWTEGFRGVVGTVRGPVGGGASLSLTGFGSYQSRSLSQYELLDVAACARARGTRCRAPEVLLSGAETPGARLVSRTLPGVFHELAGGGHAALALSPRAHVGLTGWMARPSWAVEGLELDFQASSRYPAGGPFGAVGVDAAWGAGPVDLFAEVAHSFDSAPGQGGGLGAVQRAVLGDERQELELTLRYYGHGFANPYGGASSGPDEDEGLRARNELGARVRYSYRAPWAWRVRGEVEAWALPSDGAVPGSAGTAHLRASARVDWLGLSFLQPSLWVEHRNKDLGQGGRGLCFEGSACAGEQYRVAARVRVALEDVLAVAAQYQHTLAGSSRLPEGLQQDGRAVLDVLVRPLPSLRVRGRASWLDEDLSDPGRGEQALRATVDVGWAVLDAVTTRARYELAVELSKAASARAPPEPPRHQLRLELETRF